MPERIAAIDCGTNSIKILLGDWWTGTDCGKDE